MVYRRACSVPGCHKRPDRNRVSLHCIPVKPAWRKQAFLKAIGELDLPPWRSKENFKICNIHFVNGKKSEDARSPSYIPSLHLPTKEAIEAYNDRQRKKYMAMVIKRKILLQNHVKQKDYEVQPKKQEFSQNSHVKDQDFYFDGNKVIKLKILKVKLQRLKLPCKSHIDKETLTESYQEIIKPCQDNSTQTRNILTNAVITNVSQNLPYSLKEHDFFSNISYPDVEELKRCTETDIEAVKCYVSYIQRQLMTLHAELNFARHDLNIALKEFENLQDNLRKKNMR